MASTKAHTERCRRKLGLATWDGDEESADTVVLFDALVSSLLFFKDALFVFFVFTDILI